MLGASTDPKGDSLVRLRLIVLVPLMTAVTVALGALPALPLPFTPVPITFQTLGVMLAGLLLGGRLGALSQLLLLLLVLVGAPVLAGGRGGAHLFVGPTAGYLVGWPIGAFVTGWIAERVGALSLPKAMLASLAGGLLVVYLLGIPGTALFSPLTLRAAAISALAYIPGDLAKAIIAALVALPVQRALRAAGLHLAVGKAA
jgi:biotin transport system substrate-specific component